MKPRMKILMSAISLVLVLTIGIIGVFALTQINIDTKLRVRFVAQKNVYATVSAKSYKSSQEAPVESLSPLVIDGTEEQGYEGSLEFSELIEVTQAETVDYVFEIKNTTNVVTNPELVIEPVVEFDNDFADWTIYYMADREVGYKQLSNLEGTGDTYTYIELAKGESVRVRLSIRSTNSEEDVDLDDSSMSFRLYTAPTAPALYEDDAVIINDSHLYYEVGETVALGMYPTVQAESNVESAINEYISNGVAEGVTIDGTYNGEDIYVYNGDKYAYNTDDSCYFMLKPSEFVVVETEDSGVTLFAKNAFYEKEVRFNESYNDTQAPSGTSTLKETADNLVVILGVSDVVLSTSIENIDADGAEDVSSIVKMWVPSSVEIEAWAEVLGNDFVKATETNNYVLRDGCKITYNEMYYYTYKVVNELGVVEEIMSSVQDNYVNIRPVTRIAQLDYKGF